MASQHVVALFMHVKITHFLITQRAAVDAHIIQQPLVGTVVVHIRGLVAEHHWGAGHAGPGHRAAFSGQLAIEIDLRAIGTGDKGHGGPLPHRCSGIAGFHAGQHSVARVGDVGHMSLFGGTGTAPPVLDPEELVVSLASYHA